MTGTIGIRKETKDATQRRTPLSPEQARVLIRDHNIKVLVEPWSGRIFADKEYADAGATLTTDLSPCNIIFGVKEVSPEHQIPEVAYAFFSHTVKGQAYNMPMLRSLMDKRVTLFDYELIKDEKGKRLIFFGDYAGYAGMIDTMWALGQRLQAERIPNPFEGMKYATGYRGVDEARDALREIGKKIRKDGLHESLVPFVAGFTGYGQVSKAAQSLFDVLPVETIAADELEDFFKKGKFNANVVYKVEFRKEHMYKNREMPSFDAELFKARPELFEAQFHRYLPYLTVLVNGIYWEPRFPRLVTKSAVAGLFKKEKQPRLKVIGDITCDIEGSIELTVKATTEDNPVFVYEPTKDRVVDGVEGRGPVILAVDKLPTELPREASESFGALLSAFVPALAHVDFSKPHEELGLPESWSHSMIIHKGALTPLFGYLESFLNLK